MSQKARSKRIMKTLAFIADKEPNMEKIFNNALALGVSKNTVREYVHDLHVSGFIKPGNQMNWIITENGLAWLQDKLEEYH